MFFPKSIKLKIWEQYTAISKLYWSKTRYNSGSRISLTLSIYILSNFLLYNVHVAHTPIWIWISHMCLFPYLDHEMVWCKGFSVYMMFEHLIKSFKSFQLCNLVNLYTWSCIQRVSWSFMGFLNRLIAFLCSLLFVIVMSLTILIMPAVQ